MIIQKQKLSQPGKMNEVIKLHNFELFLVIFTLASLSSPPLLADSNCQNTIHKRRQ